ncbi:MAG: hypothetical protein ACI311_05335 [Bacilli bacterium]
MHLKINKDLISKIKLYICNNLIIENNFEDNSADSLFSDMDKHFVKNCECLTICEENKSISKNKRSLENIIEDATDSWQKTVFKIIDRKNFKDPDVYKRASISKQTFSKIRYNENYQPTKDTAIQMCIGLKLNLDDSLDLLAKAGYTLSLSIARDLVIRYCIEESIYNVFNINLILEEMSYKLFSIN